MTMTLEQVITVVQELPPELLQEVGDFAVFLKDTKLPQQVVRPHLKWRGALCHPKNDLTIVSYDRDFDRTPRGRTTPGMLLWEIDRQNEADNKTDQNNDTK